MKKTNRRSRYVTTLLMGAAAVSLAACEQEKSEEVSVDIYPTVEACAQNNDAAICEQEFKNAQAQHINSAPKFATVQECKDAGFDQCEAVPAGAPGTTQQASSGGGMFMPMLMGYMMGRMMGGGMMGGQPGMAPTQQRAGAPGATAGARPVYADRNGFVYSGDRTVSRMAPGQTLSGSAPTAMRTRMTPGGDLAGPRTVSRGGFGSTGSRFSSGGGS